MESLHNSQEPAVWQNIEGQEDVIVSYSLKQRLGPDIILSAVMKIEPMNGIRVLCLCVKWL